jgi:hypothetical protein
MRHYSHHCAKGWYVSMVHCCHCHAIWCEVYDADRKSLRCPNPECRKETAIRVWKPRRRRSGY